MEGFGDILRRLRVGNGYSQFEVAQRLSAMGEPVTNKAISKWERGDTLPDVFHFLNLCHIYSVRDPYSVFMRGGASLSELGWSRVSEYVSLISRDPRFALAQTDDAPRRLIKLYDLPASAGTGVFLSDVEYEEIAADDAPTDADYALHISGDSMLPGYFDGQIVFVREQETLDVGEIGIFALNDDVYCKELGMGELISHNADYAPIPLHDYDSFYILGKVLN
jgi:transcriptional regulator with XRE-family HTH domain